MMELGRCLAKAVLSLEVAWEQERRINPLDDPDFLPFVRNLLTCAVNNPSPTRIHDSDFRARMTSAFFDALDEVLSPLPPKKP